MNPRLSLNSLLISLALNLTLLLILSICREHAIPRSREVVPVEFISLPKARLQRRSPITSPRFPDSNTQRIASAWINAPMTKEIEPSHSDSSAFHPAFRLSDFPVSSNRTSQPTGLAPMQTQPAGEWKRGDGVPSRPTRSGDNPLTPFSKGESGRADRRIAPRQPKAIITGSGDKLSGYYNISLVKYEDTSDTISADALTQLAGAMNRWTQIKTKVIREPIMLDDPELLHVPLVYITSRRPFAFSERERENLRRYFANGGFLLFSNAAISDSEGRGVANSIEFELWKILDGAAHDLVDIGNKHQISSFSLVKGAGGIYSGFFDLSGPLGLRGIALNGRIVVIYEDLGCGIAWRDGKDSKREPYLKLGVNIIAYALTTSPMAQQD
jgi:hypothetical protein